MKRKPLLWDGQVLGGALGLGEPKVLQPVVACRACYATVRRAKETRSSIWKTYIPGRRNPMIIKMFRVV